MCSSLIHVYQQTLPFRESINSMGIIYFLLYPMKLVLLKLPLKLS